MYIIEGSVSDKMSGVSSFTINGEEISLTDNKFSKSYPVNINETYTFKLKAVDKVGNVHSMNKIVAYFKS